MKKCRAVVLAAASSLLMIGPVGAQTAEPTTYVIVHGAWGGAWDWRTVDSLLVAEGHRVHRADLTGLGARSHLASADIGLETHITDVANLIVWEELTDVVLVGHSYGGMVITGVADRLGERLRELVYIDAFLPESGESIVSLLGAEIEALIRVNSRDGLIVPGWEPADKPIPRDVPHPAKTFFDAIELRNGAAAVPGRYILTAEPAQQPDDFQPFADRAAARGWPVVTLEAGHTPERSHPVQLVRLIQSF